MTTVCAVCFKFNLNRCAFVVARSFQYNACKLNYFVRT